MFDTIVLRLHGLRRYNSLKVLLFDTKTGQRRFKFIDELKKMSRSSDIREAIHYYDRDHIHELTYRKKIYLPSSNYEINYCTNSVKDYFEFEFSIPKYLYGTNVLQSLYNTCDLPGHPRTGTFNKYLWRKSPDDFLEMGGNFDYAFGFLDDFIRKDFFGTLFPEIVIDYADVQIARLDICFNQVFKSKSDALQYLAYQREIRKKYTRDSTEYVRDWKTAITYVSSLFSFKIYHKGSEFKKKDLKHLIRQNREEKYVKYDIEVLQDLADKTLRYELTCHSKYMSYLHNQNIFRHGDVVHLSKLKRYNEIRTKLNKHEVNADGELISGWQGVSKHERDEYKKTSQLINKRYQFRMEVGGACLMYHKSSQFNSLEGMASFSPRLLMLMMEKLKSFFDEFTIQQKPSEESVMDRVMLYNQRVKQMGLRDKTLTKYQKLIEKKKSESATVRKISRSLIRSFVAHLYACESYEELVKRGIYDKRTLNRILQRLKKIGFDPKNMGNIEMMNVCNDFRSYHDYILINIDKLASCLNKNY